MTNKEEQQIWLDKLKREYPEAGNTPSALNGVPRKMNAREMLTRFEVAVDAECEASIARIRVMLLGDALTTIKFDERVDQYREAYKAGAFHGAAAWRNLELELESQHKNT